MFLLDMGMGGITPGSGPQTKKIDGPPVSTRSENSTVAENAEGDKFVQTDGDVNKVTEKDIVRTEAQKLAKNLMTKEGIIQVTQQFNSRPVKDFAGMLQVIAMANYIKQASNNPNLETSKAIREIANDIDKSEAEDPKVKAQNNVLRSMGINPNPVERLFEKAKSFEDVINQSLKSMKQANDLAR